MTVTIVHRNTGPRQTVVASPANSRSIGTVRASFYAQLHAPFDLVLTDAPGSPYTGATIHQSMAMISDFHRAPHLRVPLRPVPSHGGRTERRR